MPGLRGAYPGTFDPPTVAHLAIAEAALAQAGLASVTMVVSRAPLGKDPRTPVFDDRMRVLREVCRTRPWLNVEVSDRRLIAEVASGFDAVVVGADKWEQIVDPSWYGGSTIARDRAVASLPRVLLARRAGSPPPEGLPAGSLVLEVGEHHGEVSSTLVRAGRNEWMLPEAYEFDKATGAWSDPDRYLLRSCRGGSGFTGYVLGP